MNPRRSERLAKKRKMQLEQRRDEVWEHLNQNEPLMFERDQHDIEVHGTNLLPNRISWYSLGQKKIQWMHEFQQDLNRVVKNAEIANGYFSRNAVINSKLFKKPEDIYHIDPEEEETKSVSSQEAGPSRV